MKNINTILQSKSFDKINKFYENNKFSHAYLFIGENQGSVQEFSLAVATKLVCEFSKPCLNCTQCKKMLAGFHPDVLIYPLGKSFLVADSENILDNVAVRPLEAKYKIFIINGIDNSTVVAQNKLLKTVEEAPKNVIFLFNATNANLVLPTIKSRTQILEVENFDFLKVLQQSNQYDFVVDMLKNMTSSKKILDYAPKFADKNVFEENLQVLAELFEELLYVKQSEKNEELSGLASDFENGAIADILYLITEAKKEFNANVSTNLITDNLLIKILEKKYLWNKNK